MVFTSFDNLTRVPVFAKIATKQWTTASALQPRESRHGRGRSVFSESLSRLEASLVAGVDAAPKVVHVAKLHSFYERGRLAISGNHENANGDELRKNGCSRIRYVGGRTVATTRQYEPSVNGSAEQLFDVMRR